MTTAVMATQTIRDYLVLNTDSTSRYSDGTIGSNIRAAQEYLERKTNRYFTDRPVTVTLTTEGRTAVGIPGLRSVSSATLAGTPLVSGETYNLIADSQQSGVYTGIQFRGFTGGGAGAWYLGSQDWFDRGLDLTYRGQGGVPWGSLPNDLVIVGSAGYASADLPESFLLALKVLAAIYTLIGTTVISGVAMTSTANGFSVEGGMAIVEAFIAEWQIAADYVVTV